MTQTFWEKIVGVYTYTVISADPNCPVMVISSIKVTDNVFRSEFKNNINMERRNKGVKNMDIFER